jgi:ketosteroid isomerase-like protein
MSHENVESVKAGYEAFKRGDMRAVFEMLHPEAEFIQSDELPWGGSYKGQEAIREFFARLVANVESNVSSERFIDAGDRVVQVDYTRGKARATGNEFDVPEVHIWTLENGKVIRFEAYIDNPKMLAALK